MRPSIPARWLALAALLILPLALSAAGLGAGHDPYAIETSNTYAPPSHEHRFGTDGLGRDLLARTLMAAGTSLRIVLQSVAVSFVLALALGGVAGYRQAQWPDTLFRWVVSLLFTVPFILIVVAIFAVVEPTIDRAYLVIGLIGWAAPARIVREEVIRIRSSQFVLAERAYGYSSWTILTKSILPTCFIPALLSLLFFIPELIGIEVGLSFFGLGAEPPTPTLGGLIYNGLSEFAIGWWLPVMPALTLLGITLLVVAVGGMIRHRESA